MRYQYPVAYITRHQWVLHLPQGYRRRTRGRPKGSPTCRCIKHSSLRGFKRYRWESFIICLSRTAGGQLHGYEEATRYTNHKPQKGGNVVIHVYRKYQRITNNGFNPLGKPIYSYTSVCANVRIPFLTSILHMEPTPK